MKHSFTLPFRYLPFALLLITTGALAQGPMVVNTALSPARNTIATPRTASVVVPFSQAINPVTASSIKVFSSQYRGSRTTAASTSGSTVTLVPTAPAGQSAAFKPGETVMVSVPAAVQGTTTGAAAKYVYQFTAGVAGTGTGSFQSGSDLYLGTNVATGQATGDVDADGDPDLLTTRAGANTGIVTVQLNNGGSVFSSGQVVPVGSGARSVVTGDVDGDGDLDFLTANAGLDNSVSVRFNDGTGTFGGTQEVVFSNQPYSLALGDVDGDGDLDFIATVYDFMGTSTASVRLNNGSGTFGGGQDIAVGRYSRSITLGDVDSDGDLDALTASYTLGTVGILLNDGNGLFSGSQSVAVESQPVTVALADVDGDGDLDLLATNSGPVPGTVSVRANNGSGTFGSGQNVAVGIRPTGAAVGDIDGDGDLDLLTINNNNGNRTVSIRLNNGNGTFSVVQDVPATSDAAHVALSDADGDGDLDFITAGSFASVRLNQMALATATKSPAADLLLYPNPAGLHTAVQLTIPVAAGTAVVQATVLNTLGQSLTNTAFQVQAGRATGTLPTAGLAAGIYTVRLQTGAAIVTKRFELR